MYITRPITNLNLEIFTNFIVKIASIPLKFSNSSDPDHRAPIRNIICNISIRLQGLTTLICERKLSITWTLF